MTPKQSHRDNELVVEKMPPMIVALAVAQPIPSESLIIFVMFYFWRQGWVYFVSCTLSSAGLVGGACLAGPASVISSTRLVLLFGKAQP